MIVPLLGLIELRRLLRTLVAVGRRRQRRLVYRFEGDAAAQLLLRRRPRRRRAWSTPAPPGSGLVAEAPLEVGDAARRAARAGRRDRRPSTRSPPRSRSAPAARPTAASWSARRSREIDPDSAHAADGVVLRRLQPRAPARPPPGASPLPEADAIVVSLDDYRERCRFRRRPRFPPGSLSANLARARLRNSTWRGRIRQWPRDAALRDRVEAKGSFRLRIRIASLSGFSAQ